MLKHLLFPILIYHLVITTTDGWRPYIIEVTNVSTYSLVDFIAMNSSFSNSSSFSMYMNVLRPIPNMYAKVKVTLQSSNGDYNLELINKTIDCCEFFKNMKYEPIAQVLYKALAKTGTFPNRCPIPKKLFFIKDIVIDSEGFPPVMPTRGGISDVTIMTKIGKNLKTICGYTVQVRVKQIHKKASEKTND